MTYPASPNDAGDIRVRPDSAQFWAGAAATAVVAALIALVGILICRWTLGIPILAPAGDGAWGSAHTGEYVLVAALVALVAAALLYLLELGAPAPRVFFGWIMGLATLAVVVYPFSTSAPFEQKAATAIVNLVLGVAITSLLSAVSSRAIRIGRSEPPPPGRPGAGPPRSQAYEPTRPLDRPGSPPAPGDWR
jgi:Family of unknown function (DUF6069)